MVVYVVSGRHVVASPAVTHGTPVALITPKHNGGSNLIINFSMAGLFDIIVYQPILNLLVGIYNILPNHDLGIAIIIVTILVKILFFPLSWKQLVAQKQMQEIQPKIEELKQQYKDDQNGLRIAQMKFFQEEKINPLASCLPLLVQLPFLFGMYYVFIAGISSQNLTGLYPFVANPGQLNTTFLGLFSLTDLVFIQNPLSINWPLLVVPLLAALAQFAQAKMMIVPRPPKVPGSQDEDFAAVMNQQMLYFAPLMTLVFGATFPIGLSLYWLVNTVLSVGQQMYFLRHHETSKPRGAGTVVATQ